MVDVIFIFQQLKTYFANQFPSFTPYPSVDGSEENWFAPDTTQIEPDIFNFPMFWVLSSLEPFLIVRRFSVKTGRNTLSYIQIQ